MAWLPPWTSGLLAQTRLAAHVQTLMNLPDPDGPDGEAWVKRACELIAAGARWDRPMALGAAQDTPLAHLTQAALHRTDPRPWAAVRRALAAGASPSQSWRATAPDGRTPWTTWTFLAHAHDTVGLERLQSWGWAPPAADLPEESMTCHALSAPSSTSLLDDCGGPGRPPCAPPRARFTTLVWAWRHEHGPAKVLAIQSAALEGDLDVLTMLQQEDPGRYEALRVLMHAAPGDSTTQAVYHGAA